MKRGRMYTRDGLALAADALITDPLAVQNLNVIAICCGRF